MPKVPFTEKMCKLITDWIFVTDGIAGRRMAYEAMEEDAERVCRMRKGKERTRLLDSLERDAEIVCRDLKILDKEFQPLFRRARMVFGKLTPREIDIKIREFLARCQDKGWVPWYMAKGTKIPPPLSIRRAVAGFGEDF